MKKAFQPGRGAGKKKWVKPEMAELSVNAGAKGIRDFFADTQAS